MPVVHVNLIKGRTKAQKAAMADEITEVIHKHSGAPKEVMVKITLAEPGGRGGVGTWAPATSGFTPGNENEDMKKFLSGGFIGS